MSVLSFPISYLFKFFFHVLHCFHTCADQILSLLFDSKQHSAHWYPLMFVLLCSMHVCMHSCRKAFPWKYICQWIIILMSFSTYNSIILEVIILPFNLLAIMQSTYVVFQALFTSLSIITIVTQENSFFMFHVSLLNP